MNLETRQRYQEIARKAAESGQMAAANAVLELMEEVHFLQISLKALAIEASDEGPEKL